ERERLAVDRERRGRLVHRPADQRDLLEVRPVLTRGDQPQPLEFGGQERRGLALAWRPRLPPEHRVVRKGAEQVLEVLRSERIVTAGHGAPGLRPDSAGVADEGGEGGGDAADPGVASHSSSTSVGDETKSGGRPDRLPLALPAVRIE